MTKDDIKKALECCIKGNCCDCPYYDGCTQELTTDALNLITEQEQEIEQLKANGYRSIMDAFENNRDKIVENIQTEIDDYKQSINQAKIDVLNELTVKAVSLSAIETYHICNLVDELIKELEK